MGIEQPAASAGGGGMKGSTGLQFRRSNPAPGGLNSSRWGSTTASQAITKTWVSVEDDRHSSVGEFELAPPAWLYGVLIAGLLGFFTSNAVDFVFHHLGAPGLWGAVALTLVLAYVASRIRPRIAVGNDGVWIHGAGRDRYLTWSEIERVVRAGDHRIDLELTSGRKESLVTKRGRAEHKRELARDRLRCDTLFVRLDDGLTSYRAGERFQGAAVALLRRGTRTAAAWKQDLARRGRRENDYRTESIREDELWRIVSDARAAAADRAAAAVALRPALDDAGRKRLHVIAEGTASPKLRVALAAATDEEDHALDAALDSLVTESGEARGRRGAARRS